MQQSAAASGCRAPCASASDTAGKKGLGRDVGYQPSDAAELLLLAQMNTSKSPEKLTSLDEYITRMKPDQKDILYIAGEL